MDNSDVNDIIRCLINKNNKLHETRCQRLVYLVELFYVNEKGEQLLDIEFKPFMYGPFSEKIREEFSKVKNDMSWSSKYKTLVSYEGIVDVIIGDGLSYNVDEDVECIIEDVVDITRDYTIDDLNYVCKNTNLYDDTPFGEGIDFDGLTVSDLENEIDQILE